MSQPSDPWEASTPPPLNPTLRLPSPQDEQPNAAETHEHVAQGPETALGDVMPRQPLFGWATPNDTSVAPPTQPPPLTSTNSLPLAGPSINDRVPGPPPAPAVAPAGQAAPTWDGAPGAAPVGAATAGPPTMTDSAVELSSQGAAGRSARRRSRAAMLAAAMTLVLVGGLLGGFGAVWFAARKGLVGSGSTGITVSQPQVQAGPAAPTVVRPEGSVAEVAARVLPSVVQILVQANNGEASGSGFIIDSQGHVLTNNHVVADASGAELSVVFDDGSHQQATVVARDANYDLAVLKTEIGGRAPLPFGDSDRVVVGDTVIAVGAPLGLQGTVTTGIVSAKNRPVSAGESSSDRSYINAIQTDAAINPGNSGGPLVDANGSVIGVNSAIARASGGDGNIGLGFAIPSNQAKRTAEALVTTGKASYPIIGVQLDPNYDGEGVRVDDGSTSAGEPITSGGPAAKAGIKPGDVIVAFEGRPVTSPVELVVAVRAHAPGDTVTLTVKRGAQELTLPVTLVASG